MKDKNMKKNKKDKSANWLVNRSIRFDKKKISQAEKLGVLDQLPEKCREQLDQLLSVKK